MEKPFEGERFLFFAFVCTPDGNKLGIKRKFRDKATDTLRHTGHTLYHSLHVDCGALCHTDTAPEHSHCEGVPEDLMDRMYPINNFGFKYNRSALHSSGKLFSGGNENIPEHQGQSHEGWQKSEFDKFADPNSFLLQSRSFHPEIFHRKHEHPERRKDDIHPDDDHALKQHD